MTSIITHDRWRRLTLELPTSYAELYTITTSKAFNIATQGLGKDDLKKVSIATDAEKYIIQVMALTETHNKESTTKQAKGNKKKYTVYHSETEGTNKYTGVGILIEEEIPATFTKVNDRICHAEIQMDKYKVILLVAYASTLIIPEPNPAIREDFYKNLSESTNRIKKSKHMMITTGDFNAKRETGKTEYPKK